MNIYIFTFKIRIRGQNKNIVKSINAIVHNQMGNRLGDRRLHRGDGRTNCPRILSQTLIFSRRLGSRQELVLRLHLEQDLLNSTRNTTNFPFHPKQFLACTYRKLRLQAF